MLAIEILGKGTVLLILAFALATTLRQASAATRHLVWAMGLVGVLGLPFLTAGMPWRLEVLPSLVSAWTAGGLGEAVRVPAGDRVTDQRPARTGAATDGKLHNSAPAVSDSRVVQTARSVAPAADATGPLRVTWLLLGVWVVGAGLVGARWLADWISLRRFLRCARRLEGSAWEAAIREASDRLLLDTPIRLLESDRVPMPLTAGILRPVVVLPESAREWPDDRRRAVIVHELAHVRRKDALAHALAWIACALWWFHPLVWGAARRMRVESERACDDLVLRAGTRASSYADHLLDIACHASRSRAPAPAMPLAQHSEFEGRMLRILSPDARRHGLSALKALGIAGSFAAVALPLAAIGPAPSDVARKTELPAAGPFLEPLRPKDQAATIGETLRVQGGDAAVADSDADADIDQDRDSQALIASLRDHVAEVRSAAAQALGELDDPRTVEALMNALRTDTDASVRAMAAWALGQLENPRAVPALGDALLHDGDANVREMAAWALGAIESTQGVEPLRTALRDRSPEVRAKAVWALGAIEDSAAVPALMEALSDASVEIRRTAAWALGQIEHPSAIPALVAALRDSDAEVRSTAAWAIGGIEDPSASEAMVELLKDENPEVRRAAAEALGDADWDQK